LPLTEIFSLLNQELFLPQVFHISNEDRYICKIIFDDRFKYGVESRTYFDLQAWNKQYGRTLADFLPSYVANMHPHLDPSFDSYTYGEPDRLRAKSRALLKLKQGDILFFIASLAPYDPDTYKGRDKLLKTHQRGKKNKYVIGFFIIKGVARVYTIKSDRRLMLALLKLSASLKEDKTVVDFKDWAGEYKILQDMGYVIKRGEAYELTREGFKVVFEFNNAWNMQRDEDERMKLLEQGLFSVELLSGLIQEDIIKANHHFKRLRLVDCDKFIVVAGYPECSSLLKRAVQLTERFEGFSFRLNQLGLRILKRERDTLRGFRWLDENAARILAEAVMEVNSDLNFNLQSCFQQE